LRTVSFRRLIVRRLEVRIVGEAAGVVWAAGAGNVAVKLGLGLEGVELGQAVVDVSAILASPARFQAGIFTGAGLDVCFTIVLAVSVVLVL